jgi:hypothetical protein
MILSAVAPGSAVGDQKSEVGAIRKNGAEESVIGEMADETSSSLPVAAK